MNKDYTKVLKGACCIIVILVHIPLQYQNKLQDGIGSFAYICVTLFFLISAYGMKLSEEAKPDYINHFWRNRLAALLIPVALINVCVCMYQCLILFNNWGGVKSLLRVNDYVIVLLQYCLWFYLVSLGRKLYGERILNALLIIGIVVSSAVMYFFFDKTGWCYERWGLLWGLLLYLNLPLIKKYVAPNYRKIIVLGVIALTLGVAYLKFKPVFFWGEYLLKIVLGIAIIALVFTLSSKRIWGNKAIFFLGDISYEVYLSHGFIMALLAHFCPQLSSGLFVLSTVIGTIVFSTAIHAVGKPLVSLCRHR
ncbi:MAG: acyltransferase family protein [Porphyromonadaceae bacterium]|nr:acyltransferase family protein [Porphyromonadaceae bacterium]